jgi:hypothetical protein
VNGDDHDVGNVARGVYWTTVLRDRWDVGRDHMRNGVGADADDAILHCLGRCLSESEFVIVQRFGLIRAGDGQTTEGGDEEHV